MQIFICFSFCTYNQSNQYNVVVLLILMLQSGCSLHEHCGPDERRQPYILAVGMTRNNNHEYYIAMGGELLPCQAKSSLSAFHELFKALYVFGISYDQALNSMYTFVQITIYNFDVGLSHGTPRVKDLRAKLLNWCDVSMLCLQVQFCHYCHFQNCWYQCLEKWWNNHYSCVIIESWHGEGIQGRTGV